MQKTIQGLIFALFRIVPDNRMFVKIYIADDYLLIREGIKKVINGLSNAILVGETHDLSHLPDKIASTRPDILIMELNLCERPIKELMDELKVISPNTKVLIVSDCHCELPIIMAVRAGISGFMQKNVSEKELAQAISSIALGADFFAPAITHILANGFLSNSSSPNSFSDREMEILRYICKGRSNEQVADLLFISEKTVATHKKNIMKKAGVKKTSDLILWAMDKNILQK